MTSPLRTDSTTRAPVKVQAPGKINIHLGVGGANDEGYHELATVLQALNRGETLTLVPGGTGSISVRGRYGGPAVPADATNLARRAVDVLIAALEVDRDVDVLRDIDIVIDKQVPVAGGMGGGSAGAAPPPVGAGHLAGGVAEDALRACA